MNEREAYIALNMIEGIGPVSVASLITTLGSAAAILRADCKTLMQARGIGPELAGTIVEQRGTVDWTGEIERAEKAGIRIITRLDEEYPRQLLEIHDPPLALYIKGSFQSRDKNAIAVVGTRKPTYYGRDAAGKLAGQIARVGYTVVSGLALGIDTIAHEAALKEKSRTVAVLGGGLDDIYPPSNAALAEKIAANGAVVSEFPFRRQPDKTTFAIRNRIVSGMSVGVLIVEAGIKSGAMITARQALEQGRTVFAVPGRIDSAASQGTNQLIKDGAVLVRDAKDILGEYEFLLKDMPAEARERERMRAMPQLSSEEEGLVKCLEEGEKCVDNLIRESGLKPAAVGSLLISLEMKKVVRMMPGQMVGLRAEG